MADDSPIVHCNICNNINLTFPEKIIFLKNPTLTELSIKYIKTIFSVCWRYKQRYCYTVNLVDGDPHVLLPSICSPADITTELSSVESDVSPRFLSSQHNTSDLAENSS